MARLASFNEMIALDRLKGGDGNGNHHRDQDEKYKKLHFEVVEIFVVECKYEGYFKDELGLY